MRVDIHLGFSGKKNVFIKNGINNLIKAYFVRQFTICPDIF